MSPTRSDVPGFFSYSRIAGPARNLRRSPDMRAETTATVSALTPGGARTGNDTKRPWHTPYTIDNTIGLRRGTSTSAARVWAARRDAGRLSTHEAWPQPPIRTLSSRCDLPGPYFTGDAPPGAIRRRGCQPR